MNYSSFLQNNSKEDILELFGQLFHYKNEANMWNHKIFQLAIAIVSVLDEKRSQQNIVLNSELISFYLNLDNLITLYQENKDNLISVQNELHNYLFSIPQLNPDDNIIGETSLEIHQYLASEVEKTLKVIKQIEMMKS